MRTLKRNKQKMWYSLQNGKEPIYKLDEDGNIEYITDDEGNQVPVETGEYKISYTDPVAFKGYVGSQLENAIMRAWGSDNTNNFAVLVVDKQEKDENNTLLDFPNGAIIWRKKAPVVPFDFTTAEYTVDGVMDEELNETSYYLRKRK